jgi:hypothetical protein
VGGGGVVGHSDAVRERELDRRDSDLTKEGLLVPPQLDRRDSDLTKEGLLVAAVVEGMDCDCLSEEPLLGGEVVGDGGVVGHSEAVRERELDRRDSDLTKEGLLGGGRGRL